MSVIRISLTLMLCVITLSAFGQKRFQEGYYVDNRGNRVEGLIKNDQWLDNPKSFVFKDELNSSTRSVTIDEIQEFGIGEAWRYVKANVQIDRSPSNLKFLSGQKDPQFSEETLFLKVLQSGEASLYSYKEGDLQRYFYSTVDQSINQLIYKVYSQEGRLAYNNTFKSQLLQDPSFDEPDLAGVRKLEYTKKALSGYFVKYHEAKGLEYTNYAAKEKREVLLKYRALAGINISSMVIQHERFDINNDLGSKMSFTLGAELEFFLPSPRQELSIVFQPHFSSFNTTGDLQEVVDVKYSALIAAIGFRKYLPISTKARIFLGGYVNVNVPMVDSIPLSIYLEGLTYVRDTNISLSAGLEINDKLSAEVKYSFERDLLSTWSEWTADFQTTTLQIRYSIFD